MDFKQWLNEIEEIRPGSVDWDVLPAHEKQRKQMQWKWQIPAYRKKVYNAFTKPKPDVAKQRTMQTLMYQRWQTPEYRERMTELLSQHAQEPTDSQWMDFWNWASAMPIDQQEQMMRHIRASVRQSRQPVAA